MIGYELVIVDAGWTDVSTRVRVCWGNVEMMVLYWVDTRVAPGMEVVIERSE